MKKCFGWLGLLLLAWPTAVAADGMMITPPARYVNETGQKAVIWYDGKTETLILSTSFSGNAEDFAWVIPVPSRPEISSGKDELFTALDDYTRPRRAQDNPVPMGMMIGSVGMESYADKVTVLETKKVDIYDVTVLEATEGKALRQWLEQNGYEYPATKQHLLQYYVNKNWYFVAAKVVAEATGYAGNSLKAGHATPLSLEFETKQIIYPLKISGPGTIAADGQKIAAWSFEQGQEGWAGGYVYSQSGVPTQAPAGVRPVTAVKMTQLTLVTDPVRHGNNSLKMSPALGAETGEDHAYANIFGLQGGKSYTYSATAMVNTDFDGKVKLRVKSGERVVAESKAEVFGPTKQSVRPKLTFVADLASYRLEMAVTGMREGQAVYWDAVQVEQGTEAADFAYEKLPGANSGTTNNVSAIPLVLYVFSDHKKTVPGFSIECAGRINKSAIEKLAFDDDGDPWIKAGKTMYLTKMTRRMTPAEMTDDLVIRDAADNTTVGDNGFLLDGNWKVALIFGIPLGIEIAALAYFWYSKSRKEKS